MKVNFDISLGKIKKINFRQNVKNHNTNNNTDKYNNLGDNSYFTNYYFNNINFNGNYPRESSNTNDLDIAGYNSEKEKITDLLINPISKEKETGKEQDIPAGILLYGQDAQDREDFIKGVSKILNIKLKDIDTNDHDFISKIKNELKSARQNYINKKQRTIVVIKNADNLISASRTYEDNVAQMKSWLENCAKLPTDDISMASATTFIFETDNPSSISPEILNHENFAGVISLPLRNKENIKALIKSANKKYENSSNFILSDKQAEIIANKLAPNKEGAYSTNRIKTILSKAREDWEYTDGTYKDAILERVNKTRRNINPRTVQKSKENVKWLTQNGFIAKPKIEALNSGIFRVIDSCLTPYPITEKQMTLSDVYDQNLHYINSGTSFNDDINSILVNNIPLSDFWLTLEGKNPDDYTQRTKEKEINHILLDKDKTAELISKTLDELQKTNLKIDSARRAYKDIIENENELTQEQKDILIKQQDSKLFFEVITDDLNSDDEIQLELSTLKILRQLGKEKETLRQNALNNIFNPARNIDLEDEDCSETANYVLNLLSQKALVSNFQEKEQLQKLIANFEDAINSGDEDRYKSLWQELVDLAQEYFESRGLDDITNRNITLLNSINKNMGTENNPRILSLIKNPSLTIEQREFVSRYKDDINFRRMISNPNVNIESTIEELVYFEAGNRDLIDNNGLDISYKKIMSDKFHEIDSNAKDINIQGNKISDKLDKINDTIEEQSGLISDFANNFATYADTSLALQSAQLEELVSINQNTFEIRQYTQVLTRGKLAEFEKDKYLKEIVPDLKALLPENEQIDLKEFLTKVDEIAKQEKDDIRRKKLIKAGLIIAGTVAAGALVYYAGPTVVAHLASKLPAQAALKAATSTATKVGLARSIGYSGLINNMSFTATAGVSNTTHTIMDNLDKMNTADADRALKKIKNTIRIGDSQPGNISDSTVIKIIKEFGINPSDVK